MAVRIELQSEVATSDRPAKVLVYENEVLAAEIIAEVEPQKGGDGGLYPCVKLKQKQ